jgi:hypothetical protein
MNRTSLLLLGNKVASKIVRNRNVSANSVSAKNKAAANRAAAANRVVAASKADDKPGKESKSGGRRLPPFVVCKLTLDS